MAEYFELPEELIQHIQSFLDPKESTRTSVLSKPWYSAWSTHPILTLDEGSFSMYSETRSTEFQNFARTRINRYKKLNSLRLTMIDHNNDSISFAYELILHSLNLGLNQLRVGLGYGCSRYALPAQVFASMDLKKLGLFGGRINLSRVLCSRLVSLELRYVRVGNDMMRDILLGCPLIENLELVDCDGLEKVNLSVVRRSLKTFVAFPSRHGWMNGSQFTKLVVEWEENDYAGSRVLGQDQYPNLMLLNLNRVEVDSMFFSLFSDRFPCIEKLIIEKVRIDGLANVEFASNSLRSFCYLSLIRIDRLRIHAPNIGNFSFSTETQQHIPYFSFSTASGEWKSDLTLIHPDGPADVSWFMNVGDILKVSSLSKVSLLIDLLGVVTSSSIAGGVPITVTSPFVENLIVKNCLTKPCFVVLFGWLWSCRPKFITWSNINSEKRSYETLELIYNELKMHAYKKTGNYLPFFIHGLEEVHMETSEKLHSKLHRLRLKWSS